MFRRLALAALSLPLAACAANRGDYPSLEIRDVERVQGSFEANSPAAVPAPPVPASVGLVQRLSELQDEAASAHRAFLNAAPAATRLAAAAGGIGSDSWAAAQVALADLDSLRSQAAVALAELDVLFIDSTLAANRPAEIAATRQEVLALISEEDAVLARLRARVSN